MAAKAKRAAAKVETEDERELREIAELTEASIRYSQLVEELLRLEERTGLYLTDANVDAENALDGGAKYGTTEFWKLCYASATCAAGQRATDAGQDINRLIGRVIY